MLYKDKVLKYQACNLTHTLHSFPWLFWGVTPQQLFHSKQLCVVNLMGHCLLHSCQSVWLGVLQNLSCSERCHLMYAQSAEMQELHTCGKVRCMSSTVTPLRVRVNGRLMVGRLTSSKCTVISVMLMYRLSILPSVLSEMVACSRRTPASNTLLGMCTEVHMSATCMWHARSKQERP